MRELALFSGGGGGILGGKLLGWRTVCAVEFASYPRRVLLARQRDGLLPRFPIWDDVRTFDGKPWRGHVDVISGGFPCQDISSAGKGAGLDGDRSGLWSEMARIIGEVRPRFVFVENSPMLTSRGLGRVLGDLAAMGFDAEWGVLGAHHAGAPHRRDRIWILALLADAEESGRKNGRLPIGEATTLSESVMSRWAGSARKVSDADGDGYIGGPEPNARGFREVQGDRSCDVCSEEPSAAWGEDPGAAWWATEPALGRVVDGLANRVDRLRALGNGQVPQCAALAVRVLAKRLGVNLG